MSRNLFLSEIAAISKRFTAEILQTSRTYTVVSPTSRVETSTQNLQVTGEHFPAISTAIKMLICFLISLIIPRERYERTARVSPPGPKILLLSHSEYLDPITRVSSGVNVHERVCAFAATLNPINRDRYRGRGGGPIPGSAISPSIRSAGAQGRSRRVIRSAATAARKERGSEISRRPYKAQTTAIRPLGSNNAAWAWLRGVS